MHVPMKTRQTGTKTDTLCRVLPTKLSQGVLSPGLSLERSAKSDLHPSRIALGFPDKKDGWVCWEKKSCIQNTLCCSGRVHDACRGQRHNNKQRQSNSQRVILIQANTGLLHAGIECLSVCWSLSLRRFLLEFFFFFLGPHTGETLFLMWSKSDKSRQC